MLKIRQIKIDYKEDTKENLEAAIKMRLHLKKSAKINYEIIKKSLDARYKPNIYYVYEVELSLPNEDEIIAKLHDKDVVKNEKIIYQVPFYGKEILSEPIVVVGSGPAGLFAAYNLCKEGYSVIVIERGNKVEERISKVEKFWQDNILDPECNIQFGEGGAGTFSDGKLNTMINDHTGRYNFVMQTFVNFGAPEEIIYSNKPHIGTDILRKVIINMRHEIIRLGGTFLFNTKLTDIDIENKKIKSITINDQEKISCQALILALGHSARDTFRMLNDRHLNMINKPFAVGLRVMHKQSLIDLNQYGINDDNLPVASYKLTYTAKNKKGVYSFCMCPGGYVVNASSIPNHLCINGMSYYKRDSGIANSAIIVTVNETDYGSNLFDGVRFQEELEKRAYTEGQGLIPIQLLKDYHSNRISTGFKEITPAIKGGYHFANLNNILPDNINVALKEAFVNFDTKIKGFNDENAIVCGIESRTSSPIRMLRNEYYESNILGVYPCGEGAGYAGGITSAAIDGLKVSEAIIVKYSPNIKK